MLILLIVASLHLGPVQHLVLRLAGCNLITQPVGPDTVAVKWSCPN